MKLKEYLFKDNSLAAILLMVGFAITLVITLGNCVYYYYEYMAIEWRAIYIPLLYGAFITPIVTGIVVLVFSDIEKDRKNILDLQKKESELKNSLARTYIDIINQRERNSELSKDHAKLRGTLDNEISQRKETQEKLDQQLSFFSAIINLTPDIILYKNSDGLITGCNDNIQNLLKVGTIEDLKKLFINDHDLNDIFAQSDDLVRSTKKDITYEAHINGYIFQMRKRPALNQRGGLVGIITYGHDITKLKHEHDLLEKASRDKSNFISTLSHELRTPLNGIVGLSDILLQTNHFKGDDERHLKAINVNAVTLGNIFNDVIDLNKMERQTFNVVLETIKWPDFLDALETLVSLMAQQKNLGFNFKVDGDSPQFIKTDPTRLRQILWNLAANAVKFTKEGSVGIKVIQSTENNKLRVQFRISDTGIGIAKEEQSKIFGLYYQVAGTKQSTGTGIGLHVTKNFCHALGGEVSLESELGKGSTFILSFSFDIMESDAPNNSSEAKKTSLNVLLVEDVDLNILVAKTMLEKLGHKVVAAKTGASAIETYASRSFDLVLLDMQLPDMTGLDIADKLVADYHINIPMIALTANVVADQKIYEDHHIVGVMNKPLTAKKLAETLGKFQG